MTVGEPNDAAARFTVTAVARRFGIPVATLRSWNQRYGVGPSVHRPGEHRKYTTDDMVVIARMVELVRAGASPSSAARAARVVVTPVPALGDVTPVLSAAMRLDLAELLATIAAHFSHYGVVATWNLLCRPAFAAIVNRQQESGGDIDVEHVLSWVVVTSLHRISPRLRVAKRIWPIVLACADGEHHAIPLEVLRAALAERGVPTVFLGPAVPDGALTDALSKHDRPPIVALWSQSSRTATAEAIHTAWAGSARLVLVGPGWDGRVHPPDVLHLDSLEGAIEELCRAAIGLSGDAF
ncbi:MerR family transcriptional regulator [Nocardia xishanensis]